MIKKFALSGLLGMCIVATNAQPIFSYGKNTVTKEEFVKAFNKNPTPSDNRKQSLKEYLDLYINFKLKVQAAYDAKLQQDPTQKYELDNFKKQVAENIINEEANIMDLSREAFNRSLKDIHLAQVFIELNEKEDSTEAFRKIRLAYEQLKAGKEFSTIAQEYSNDPFTIQTSGDLGFITAFTLPYDFENVAYSLKPGSFSAPFKSKLGYHIFKNLEERKGLGRRQVAQILVSYPPGSGEAEKSIARRKADSVYNLLHQDSSRFSSLVHEVSADVSTVNNDGQLAEFGVGQFSQPFEQAAFALSKPGEVSKPFETNYGFHILKLIAIKPVGNSFDEPETAATFRDRTLQDDRLNQSRKALVAKRLALIRYKPAAYDAKQLWSFTDSSASGKNITSFKNLNEKTVLFSFAKQQITVGDWLKFARAVRTAQTELGKLDYPALMKEYVAITGGEYYRNHLEDYNPAFKQQVEEFMEANLLFGIMDKNVWARANVDTAGMLSHYNSHKQKYQWSESADALIVSCDAEDVYQQVSKRLKDSVANWRMITGSYGNLVTADSGRYELGQLPVVDRTNFSEGLLTAPVKNESDNSTSFNYIFKLYPGKQQRSFDDARGMVISDYQQVLEEKWLAQLKKKYPVKINQAVFNTLK
ncbi:hypothetical protein EXU57_13765 [Segetibacter sp. 3557_3]|uniref:peptidylprolyl isomerase n=1 Tax=Segetibacter sp. 3557_3 TaxID=2547429 RepID=UPI0010590815|nr:peptidylprolyl isomerase [Segetibacter sp. 3557_3]TDH25169.1 hypothetical protein EXU57_13765 [Segetibacter sp. 3557_3]